MRDAFGGVFTMNFMLVFIFIFVAFSAVSLNYAKAFRLKNSVIDFVEQNEIINLGDIDEKADELNAILNNANYYKPERCPNGKNGTINNVEGNRIVAYCYNGIYIYEISRQNVKDGKNQIIQYGIITYADWDLGALNKILVLGGKDENSEAYITGMWPINGEAQVVARIS